MGAVGQRTLGKRVTIGASVLVAAVLAISFLSHRSIVASAEEQVRSQMKDPGSAVFSAIETHGSVVCGVVNSRNSYGGFAGPQRFVAGGIVVLEEQSGPDVMDALWSKECAS